MRCRIKFSIKYKTEYGQNVYILGSILELGNWQDYKTKLDWTEGNIWTSILSLPQQHFEYKYVVHNSDRTIWENGRNRQCNPVGLESLVLNDTWESFIIRFLIYHPLPEGTVMQINGCLESLGGNHDSKSMHLTTNNVTLSDGVQGKLWEFEIIVPITTDYIWYKYMTYDAKKGAALWEGEPARKLGISQRYSFADVMKQKAQITASEVANVDVPINGVVTRLDMNFVTDINFDRIADYPIIIGAYPQHEEDIKLLTKNGVTAVLNVQTEDDMKLRRINLPYFCEMYARYNIKLVHYPIYDFNPEDLEKKVRGGSVCLWDLIAKGHTVYVHCTAGMGRSAAMVVGYLVLYKGMELDEAFRVVKKSRKVVCPNMQVLWRALVEGVK